MWQHHRRQVHVRTQSTKQATKSTTPSSQHRALVTVSMHRDLDSPHADLSPPVNVTRTPSVLATAWVEAPVKRRPGALSATPTGTPLPSQAGATSTYRRERLT